MQGDFRETLGPTAVILAHDERFVVWRWVSAPTFPDAPFNVHPLVCDRIAGSGTYDLTRVEAEKATGLSW